MAPAMPPTTVVDVHPPTVDQFADDPVAARFWAKVRAVAAPAGRWNRGACWVWTGATRRGYGAFWPVAGAPAQAAHRWVWQHVHGPIPPGLTVDHLCHDPHACPDWRACPHRLCVRFDHLGAVTRAANGIRNLSPPALNAAKLACDEGHPLHGPNLYVRFRGGRPRRVCRTCQARYWRRWSRRLAARERARGDDLGTHLARVGGVQGVLF